MTRHYAHLETTGRVRHVPISLPRVSALEGDPSYQPREDAKPLRHRTRAPSLKTLVKMALKADCAEQLGQALRKRFERKANGRGLTDAELDEIDRLAGGARSLTD